MMNGIDTGSSVATLTPSIETQSPEDLQGLSTKELSQEFESLFTSLLLKQMRQSSSEDSLFPGDSSDTYGGLFDMYMGRHIAQNGGIGLAEAIETAIDQQK